MKGEPAPNRLAASAANSLIDALSPDTRRELQPRLQRVHLPAGTVLCRGGETMRHAYFPITGLISLVGSTSDGQLLQVAAVDRRGFVGVPIVLGTLATTLDIVVHVPGEAERIGAADLRAHCQRSLQVRQVAFGWIDKHVAAIAQGVLCHRFHTVRQRLCRWLLALARSLDGRTVPLTQECLAHILGSPRSTVSGAAITLQDHGLIRLRHGRIHILDRSALEAWACECYAADPVAFPSSRNLRGDALCVGSSWV